MTVPLYQDWILRAADCFCVNSLLRLTDLHQCWRTDTAKIIFSSSLAAFRRLSCSLARSPLIYFWRMTALD